MKKKYAVRLLAASFAVMQMLSGCGGNTTSEEETDTTSQVASSSEMADPVELDTEGLTAVTGDQIKDGTYEIDVESSSSMFNITACSLTVEDGSMSAVMTMSGTGYLYVYMGTGEEAAAASEDSYISYVENENGEHAFEVPVEALDQEISCAAFSKNKEKWYDRTLIFSSASLPADAMEDGAVTTVESLGLADGQYTAEVTLEGGSGRASVESPVALRIENGQAYATIIWSSSNYDYMKVDDVQYDLVNTEGNSTFEIPVGAFDKKLEVIADTVAMSQPYEIEYTLYFDSTTIESAE